MVKSTKTIVKLKYTFIGSNGGGAILDISQLLSAGAATEKLPLPGAFQSHRIRAQSAPLHNPVGRVSVRKSGRPRFAGPIRNRKIADRSRSMQSPELVDTQGWGCGWTRGCGYMRGRKAIVVQLTDHITGALGL